MTDLASQFVVPQWLVGLGGLVIVGLMLLRSRRLTDGVKISQALAWLAFGLAYLWLNYTNVALTDPLRPFVVRGALGFLVLIEIINQMIMLRYGRRV